MNYTLESKYNIKRKGDLFSKLNLGQKGLYKRTYASTYLCTCINRPFMKQQFELSIYMVKYQILAIMHARSRVCIYITKHRT
jgi:hypothetical protein